MMIDFAKSRGVIIAFAVVIDFIPRTATNPMKSASTRRHTSPRIAVALLAIAALCAADIRPAAAAEDPSTKTTGGLHVRVVDRDGKALPDATLFASIWTNEKG